jgi:GYF domain 2
MLTRLFAFFMVLGGMALGAFGTFVFIGPKTAFPETLAGIICLGSLILIVGGLTLESLFLAIRQTEQRLSEQISELSPTPPVEAEESAISEPCLGTASRLSHASVEYFYGDGLGNKTGPVDYITMRRLVRLNKIGPETPVVRSDSANWLTLADFPELET